MNGPHVAEPTRPLGVRGIVYPSNRGLACATRVMGTDDRTLAKGLVR